MRSIFRGGVAAAAAVLAAQPALAQAPRGETGAFVVTIGTDTLAVEKFTRTREQLTGELVSRSPRTVTRSYAAQLNPDGSVRQLEMTSRMPDGSQPETVASVQFTPDSVISRVQRGDSVFVFRLGAANAFPYVGYSHVFFEQALMHARAIHADSVDFTAAPVGANRTVPLPVKLVGADSAHLWAPSGLQRVAVDAAGRVQTLDGIRSTQKFLVTRAADIDVDAFAAEFARRDAAHRGVGALSPRDSVVVTLAGARLSVDYGRPFARGREIYGNVVPWGEVWRTGANAATGFSTSRDVVIGGTAVPAGKYTLWTLPTQQGWTLIVNGETGQWGTEYKAERDVARIPMQTRPIVDAVEEFTIRIDPQGDGGVLRLQWDELEAFVPVTVK